MQNIHEEVSHCYLYRNCNKVKSDHNGKIPRPKYKLLGWDAADTISKERKVVICHFVNVYTKVIFSTQQSCICVHVQKPTLSYFFQ